MFAEQSVNLPSISRLFHRLQQAKHHTADRVVMETLQTKLRQLKRKLRQLKHQLVSIYIKVNVALSACQVDIVLCILSH